MSTIFQKAKAIRTSESEQRRSAEAASRKRRTQDERDRALVCRSVARLLRTELDGKNGYSVKKPEGRVPGIFGQIAVVELRGSYVGTVCVDTYHYKWRGSDESPEQDMEDTRIFFAPIVNDGNHYVTTTVPSTYPWAKAVEEAVDGFRSGLARFIASRT